MLKFLRENAKPLLVFTTYYLSFLNFVYMLDRFIIKLFKTANIAIVDCCLSNFGLDLPGVLWSKRVLEFDVKFAICYLLYNHLY